MTNNAKCKNHEKNMAVCNCTYEPCPRKGYCCECIAYHMRSGELPAGNQISTKATVRFDPDVANGYRVDWQRTY